MKTGGYTGNPERLTALFPPGKGGGEGVAYGRKGKGVPIHSIAEGSGMPLSCETAAETEKARYPSAASEARVGRKEKTRSARKK